MTTEAEFQGQVVELARLLGWKCLHVRRSIGKGSRWTTTTSVVGWPDLLLYRPGRMIAAELKSETGKATSEQLAVLEDLAAAGCDVFVWRPDDWEDLQGELSAHRLAC